MQLETTEAVEIIDITDKVAREVPADLDAGLCTIFVHHTTTGVVNNEAESGLLTDIESWLADIVDDRGQYRHDQLDENAAAHLRSVLLGSSVSVPISDGALQLGTWQRILFIEGDGPRTRTISVIIVPSM